MSTYYQCENCGRSFHSSTDPYCWECRSVAADATFAGGSVANAATFAGVLSFICKAVLAWVGLMILFFAIAGYLLIASIVPLAFSITSIYLTVPLSGSGFPDIPSAVLPRAGDRLLVDTPQDAGIRLWQGKKGARVHTRIFPTRTGSWTGAHLQGSASFCARHATSGGRDSRRDSRERHQHCGRSARELSDARPNHQGSIRTGRRP